MNIFFHVANANLYYYKANIHGLETPVHWIETPASYRSLPSWLLRRNTLENIDVHKQSIKPAAVVTG